jgi:hypothetical protein
MCFHIRTSALLAILGTVSHVPLDRLYTSMEVAVICSTSTAYCGSWAEHRGHQVSLCHPLIAKAIAVFLTNVADIRNPPTAPSGQVLRQGSHAPKVDTRFV